MGAGATLFSTVFSEHYEYVHDKIDFWIHDEELNAAAKAFVDVVADIAFEQQDSLMKLKGLSPDQLEAELRKWLHENLDEIYERLQERGIDVPLMESVDFENALEDVIYAYKIAYEKSLEQEHENASALHASNSGINWDDIEATRVGLKGSIVSFGSDYQYTEFENFHFQDIVTMLAGGGEYAMSGPNYNNTFGLG